VFALTIYSIAAILSYFSVVEAGGGNGGKYDIYVVLDVSGSMGSPISKLNAAKEAAINFLKTIDLASNPNLTVGLITFSTEVYVNSHLTSDDDSLISIINGLSPLDATSLGDAIKIGVDMLIQEGSSSANWTIVAMTDGQSNADHIISDDSDVAPLLAADYANQNNVTVHAIAFGSDADTAKLHDIAARTGGKYYFASTGGELIEVFGEVASTFVSAVMHYGSRILMLIAMPLILFLPEIQEGVTTIYRTIMKKPTELRVPELKGLRCPECGHLNRPTAKFCGSCRISLVVVNRPCPECGYVNRVGARFCGGCGIKLREIRD